MKTRRGEPAGCILRHGRLSRLLEKMIELSLKLLRSVVQFINHQDGKVGRFHIRQFDVLPVFVASQIADSPKDLLLRKESPFSQISDFWLKVEKCAARH
jgi:hypothetical protein